jgi:hypothetical protein
MARGKRASIGGKRGKAATPRDAATDPATDSGANKRLTGPAGVPLPSPVAGTNLVIADIVLRAAGGLLRDRLEKGLLVRSYDTAKAEKLVDKRGLASSVALWGASSLARRSPLGLAVVAGGLAAKVFYDRGKRLEMKRRAKKSAEPDR